MKDTDQVPRDEVVKLLATEPEIWLRVAEFRDKDTWRVALFEMVGGAQPPRWRERCWEYESARFASVRAHGQEVYQWLVGNGPALGGLRAELPEMHDPMPAQHHQSGHSQGVYEPLDWPVVEYTLSSQTQRGTSASPLIDDHLPSFFQFQAAAAHFFGTELTGRNMESGDWMFRRQDTTGRITRVRLKATGTEVNLEGHDLAGITVEVASDVPGESQVISSSQLSAMGALAETTVEFPGALPPHAWVLLKRNMTWVDRRFLNWGYRTSADEGIEEVVEPQDQLDSLVSLGEGPSVEFKVELPPLQPRNDELGFLRTVAAFANGDGGTILFGVADDGEAVGLTRSEVDGRTRDRVTTLVRANVAPLVAFSIDVFDVEGKPDKVVLGLSVETGPEPPYGVTRGGPSYYLRRGATTFPISPQEVRRLARSQPPMAPQLKPPWG